MILESLDVFTGSQIHNPKIYIPVSLWWNTQFNMFPYSEQFNFFQA